MSDNIDNFIQEFNDCQDVGRKIKMFYKRSDVQVFIQNNLGSALQPFMFFSFG